MEHFEPAIHRIVPDPKPCNFCPCDAAKGFKIPQAVAVCLCPCHWQNVFGLTDRLKAVKHFFADELSKI